MSRIGMGALDGKVALVTGATRGIGRGCALELAAAGARVFGLGRTRREGDHELPGSLDSLVAEAEREGGSIVPIACDLRADDQIEALFATLAKSAGRLDVVVNAAFLLPDDIEPDRPFFETPIAWYDDMLDVGTRSAYVLLHQASQLMVPAGSGLVVNISSAGARDFHLHLAYSVGKCALERITRDGGMQLHPYGVAVVSIWPYFVRTERLAAVDAEEWNHDMESAESQRFTGRGVVALASDPNVLARSGGAFTSRELALAYGFEDVGGGLPGGPDRAG
jgi:NAD(P)-dependent dehydrogenase (short-subunit alcohol dehydrogenase family)